MSLTITVAPHPHLEVGAFVMRFDRPLVELSTPRGITALIEPGVQTPLITTDTVRAEVRQLLRHAGFKPAGRSKPAAEYLHAAHSEGRFPQINAAVDACNVASLCSGLPISLVDLDRVVGPLSIGVCPIGTSYEFNPSGQLIDAGGLLAVFDSEGPTGTPVKDAQRTKTHDGTRSAIAVVSGTRSLPGRTMKTTGFYRELVTMIEGARIEDVIVETQSLA